MYIILFIIVVNCLNLIKSDFYNCLLNVKKTYFVSSTISIIHFTSSLDSTHCKSEYHKDLYNYVLAKNVSRFTKQNRTRKLLSSNQDFQINLFIKSINQTLHIININQLNQSNIYKRHDNKPKYVFMFLYLQQNTSIEDYLTTFKYKPYWDRNVKLIIIIQGTRDLNIVLSCIKILWSWTKVLNSIVMLINDQRFYFYTWSPYESCQHNDSLQLVDVWRDGGFLYNNNLFVDKLKTKFKCTSVKATMTNLPPFTILDNDPLKQCGDGFEHRAMKTITNFYNLSLVNVELPEGENIWIRGTNKQLTGGAGMIYRQQVDVIFTALILSLNDTQYGDPLRPHLTEQFLFLIPKRKLKPTWLNVIRPFDIQVWFIVISTYIATTICVYLISKTRQITQYNTISKTMLFTWRLILKSSVKFKTKVNFLKIFMFLVLVYSFVISTAYESSILRVLTDPAYFQQMTTFQQLVDSDLDIYVLLSLESKFLSEDNAVWKQLIKSSKLHYFNPNMSMFKRVADRGDISFVGGRIGANFRINLYFIDKNGQRTIDILKQVYLDFYIVPYMSVNNPLFSLFDSKFSQIIEAGLLEFWHSELIYKCKPFGTVSDDFVDDDDDGPEKLTLKHVQSNFMILVAGYVVGLLMFICEVVSENCRWSIGRGRGRHEVD